MKVDQLQTDKLLNLQKVKQNNKVEGNESFKKVFSNALHKVNNLQQQQDIMAKKLATGEVDNIHQVMVTSTKAKLALDLTLEIRNKAVESYKEIMRMQV